MPPSQPPVVRAREIALTAWSKYMALWRAGRGGIAVALLIPCCLCSALTRIVSGPGSSAPGHAPGVVATQRAVRDPATNTPRPTRTARPTTAPRPTRTAASTTEADEPATDAPPAPVLPTGAPPTAAPAPQIQPLLAVPPEQPAAPPPQSAAAVPRRGSPQGSSCPAGLPVKGNQGSPDWIYHVPGGGSYDRTQPEECFATPGDAEAAGYRAARN